MRKQLFAILGALLVSATIQIHAQSTNTPPTLGGIGSTALGWMTSINTNYSFADVIMWDGPVYQNGLNIANELGGSYDLWHSVNVPNNATGTLFDSIEGRARQAGIAGTFASEGVGDEFGYMKGDLRFFGFAQGVYLDNPNLMNTSHREAYEVGLQVEKLFTANGSGAALFVSKQEHQRSPLIGGQLSISFGTVGGLINNFGL